MTPKHAENIRRATGKPRMGDAHSATLDQRWVFGSFLDRGEIDQFMIHVLPKVISEGIPLMNRVGARTVPRN